MRALPSDLDCRGQRQGVDPVLDALPAAFAELQILDLIVSSNIARRHLNQGQRTCLAVEYEERYATATKVAETERNVRPHAALPCPGVSQAASRSRYDSW
ncbi:MAG: hypothetical protein ACRDS1_05730 [Pseudonocardiaceae bacterium]